MKIDFTVLSVLGMAAPIFGCQFSTETTEKYNVLYISMEDMYPYLNCYGHDFMHTPNLDAFAEESVTFLDAHCQVALCTPSRTSILTGIRPSTSGIVKINDNWQEILLDAISLPRHFRNNGYFTYKLGKISDPRNGGMDNAWNIAHEEWGIKTNEMVYPALDTLNSIDKPFFMAIGYSQTHDPWDPASHCLNEYSPDEIPDPGPHRIYKGDTLTDQQTYRLAMKYYAEITEVDSLIGGLLERFKSLDFYDNTLIIIGALDHGYSLGYQEHWGKGNNYDTETRVPLFIRIPGNKTNGQKTKELIELVDIYPSLIDLCSLPDPPQELEGYSLRELLHDPGKQWKKAVFTHRAYHVDDRGLKTKDYNLILRKNQDPMLFDRNNDPENRKDISESHFELVDSLTSLMDEGWESVRAEL